MKQPSAPKLPTTLSGLKALFAPAVGIDVDVEIKDSEGRLTRSVIVRVMYWHQFVLPTRRNAAIAREWVETHFRLKFPDADPSTCKFQRHVDKELGIIRLSFTHEPPAKKKPTLVDFVYHGGGSNWYPAEI